MFFSTANLMSQGPSSEISPEQLSALLLGRKFGKKEDEQTLPMNPKVPEYSDEEMKELMDYCQKRGIIGVNFNGMNPRATLQMLKAKTGDRSSINETKKVLLNG
jgi:hypothetical protein